MGDRVRKIDDEIRCGLISSIEERRVKVYALVLADHYIEHGNWSGKKPNSIMAGAEYAARLLLTDPKKNQEYIAEKYGLGIDTIRRVYQDIHNNMVDIYGLSYRKMDIWHQ